MRPTLFLLPLLALLPSPAGAQFANFPPADLVLGATGFNAAGDGAAGASGLNGPAGVAIDPISGKLFVAVPTQNRVLRFANAAALASGANAEAVLGQINFTGTGAATTQTGMSGPNGVSVDRQGRLWVADSSNHRVLRFDGAATLANGAPADRVFGQANFTSGSFGSGQAGFYFPYAVFADALGNLWVSDYVNNRVLRFANAAALGNGASASAVLGQPTFAIISAGTTQAKMQRPGGLFLDSGGRLWVADPDNRRVLRFNAAAGLASGSPADGVLGQANFTSSVAGVGPAALDTPIGVAADAVGTLYVTDRANHRVLLFQNAASKANGGPADRVLGQVGLASKVSGVSARRLDAPSGSIALGNGGALWVCDFGNKRVLRFSPDRIGPTLRVTSRVPARTSSPRLALAGTATDPSGVVAVRVRVNAAPPRLAVGTASWRATARLARGPNRITLVATDGAGNESVPRRLRVRRTS
jgi:sugar lactone lactonase YvrE